MESGLPDEDDVPMLVDTDVLDGDMENIESNLGDTLRLVKVPITIVTGMQCLKHSWIAVFTIGR